MKKLLIILLAGMISCAGAFHKTEPKEQPKPEACCIYQDGVYFMFCVDGKKFGIKLVPAGILFGGFEGECSCPSETNDPYKGNNL